MRDLPALREMGRRFHDAARPEWPWSDEGFDTTIRQVMGAGFLALTERGFLAGLIAPQPLNPAWRVAHELLWWSEDRKGLDLIRAFRRWAEAQGASEIKWSCRAGNERVTRVYARIAAPSEIYFSEILPCVSAQ